MLRKRFARVAQDINCLRQGGIECELSDMKSCKTLTYFDTLPLQNMHVRAMPQDIKDSPALLVSIRCCKMLQENDRTAIGWKRVLLGSRTV